eukprot:3002895-Pyramimonas_sp.AAC.1
MEWSVLVDGALICGFTPFYARPRDPNLFRASSFGPRRRSILPVSVREKYYPRTQKRCEVRQRGHQHGDGTPHSVPPTAVGATLDWRSFTDSRGVKGFGL